MRAPHVSVVPRRMSENHLFADQWLCFGVAGVANGFVPPCNSSDTGTGTLKCEACPNGCQVYSLSPKEPDRLANERAYYPLPRSSPPADVLLFRAHSGTLWGSVRTDISKGQTNWSAVAETTIPNDNSNLNAGVLPDGKGVFLLSNAAPAHVRDPLTIALSKDGARKPLLRS